MDGRAARSFSRPEASFDLTMSSAAATEIMKTPRLLCVQVDYAGVTRLLSSREGKLGVASINGTEHVWDLLPRNQRW